ncbi:hypothetical protein [Prosthecobacter dejongeii]|uniref:Uncharacterized protein n=1 Tax=Prosthecobacter dejongeii TaxID=48465 RepID=A0A7W7YMG1_9BACT|nr:hypothetical protein [Prosthecobacter dejongeii]MBB5038829.1 hypothetical protein [Prosthecobacter dejongeii]
MKSLLLLFTAAALVVLAQNNSANAAGNPVPTAQTTPPAVDMSDPRVAAFVKEENASRERALAKYSVFMLDKTHDFNDLVDLEISRAEKSNDEVLTKPNWPEAVCDRVFEKHKARWQHEAMNSGKTVGEALPAAAPTPAPAPVGNGLPSGPITFTDAVGRMVIDGAAWRGQVHEYRDGKISVTADVTAGKLVWVAVERLGPETKGWLGFGGEAEKAAFEAYSQRQQDEHNRAEATRQQALEMQQQERHNMQMQILAQQRMQQEAKDRREAQRQAKAEAAAQARRDGAARQAAQALDIISRKLR